MSDEPSWRSVTLGPHLEDPTILAAVSASLPGGAATAKTKAYWEWKHVANVFGRSTGTYGVAASGDVVGVRSFMRWQFGVAHESVRAVRAVDTVTAAAWRGNGVFTRLTRAAIDGLERDGVDLIFNTPNRFSAPGYIKMGWRRVGRLPLYVRPLKPFRAVWRLLDRNPSAPELTTLAHDAPRWTEFRQQTQVADLVSSHESARRGGGLRTSRSVQYLDWRYGSHPQATYQVVSVARNGVTEGFAILRPNVRYGLRELIVVELFARDASQEIMAMCLTQATRSCNAHHMIAHFAAGSPELAAVQRAWFLTVPRKGIDLYARAVSGYKIPSQPSGWDLALGDLELF